MALRQCAQLLQQGWALLPDGDQLVAQGADPVANTPDQFGEQIREELKLWAQFIKQTGIKPE
jgi:hypothetical protein